jgi:glucose-1-phosphate cytidylyltransferase
MKVVILAGGHGTRIADLTNLIPKPMVPIGGIPILVHIMKIYSSFGYKEFCILLGHKGSVIKEYFLSEKFPDWKINLIETGEDTMTGGRLLRAREFIDKDTFFLTYGDGLGNININTLLEFHRKKNKIMTVTTVRPPARFGELELDNDLVTSFDEKPQMQKGWINGGFFVVDPIFIDYIKDETIMLEREPMQYLTKKQELVAFRHNGYWQCMDTKREFDHLNSMWNEGRPGWIMEDK